MYAKYLRRYEGTAMRDLCYDCVAVSVALAVIATPLGPAFARDSNRLAATFNERFPVEEPNAAASRDPGSEEGTRRHQARCQGETAAGRRCASHLQR
jgi:hypothetical protein